MLIGVDFDNTIVCYDELFYKVALERMLIPANLSANKTAIRNYLRRIGQEDKWTEMQGYVYGFRMITEAEAFPGVHDFFVFCQRHGFPVRIISHKTRYPYRGEPYDLHQAAREWLVYHGFDHSIDLLSKYFFAELTKAEKLQRIQNLGCTYFIDDLPEFLTDANFPADVQRILFDPANEYGDFRDGIRVSSWTQVKALFG